MARWKRCWSFRPPSIRAAPLTRWRRTGFGRTVAEHELTRIRGLANRLRKPRNGRGREAATPARINRFSTPHECRDCPGDLSPRFWSDRRREARRPCRAPLLAASGRCRAAALARRPGLHRRRASRTDPAHPGWARLCRGGARWNTQPRGCRPAGRVARDAYLPARLVLVTDPGRRRGVCGLPAPVPRIKRQIGGEPAPFPRPLQRLGCAARSECAIIAAA